MASKNPPAVPRRRYADFCNKIGTNRTWPDVRVESAFRGRAEVGFRGRQLRVGPRLDIWPDPSLRPTSAIAQRLVRGKSTWLFPVEEILPLGGADGPKITAAITSRYAFRHPPANPTREDIEKNGLKFAGGQMVHDGHPANIIEFIVFNDGIVAVSTSTEDAEAFLNGIYKFLVSEFGFRTITSNVKKVMVSTVVVDFETSLTNLVRGHKAEKDIVAEHLNAVDDTDFPPRIGPCRFCA
jgi:hypothetical protein